MIDADSGKQRDRIGRFLTSPWILVFAVLLSFFWQLGAVPLYDLDEGAFTEATREMLAGGNYITPHKDGEPRYDKPVMIYWLQAASVKLFGLNELALRLPSALAATLWVWALWLFARMQFDARSATVAALVMTLCLQVSIIAKAAVADAVLNLFIALAFFEIYRFYRSPQRGYVLRAYLWMGLGFLTKGPVAVFFPVLVSFLFFLSEGALKTWWRAAFAPLGWLIFVLVAGPWYLAIYLDNGIGFFESFFLKHNVGRFGDAMHGHQGFPGYYLVVLPLILMPFTSWFLRLIPTLRTAWQDPLDRFLWIWFIVVFLFFSFSGTKLPHYMLYGAVPLFVLMARRRELLRSRWLALMPPLLFFLLLFGLPEIVDIAAERATKAHRRGLFELGAQVLDRHYRLVVLGGLIALLALALWRSSRPWQVLIAAGFIQILVVYGVLVPRVFDVMQAPVKEAGLIARGLDLPTVVYRTSMPSFSVYRQAITPDRAPRSGELVFLRRDKLARLASEHSELVQEVLFERGAVALLRVSARADDG